MEKIIGILCNVLMIIVSLFAGVAILWFFIGSLELYPTAEQQERVRIVAIVIVIFCLVIDGALLFLKKKYVR